METVRKIEGAERDGDLPLLLNAPSVARLVGIGVRTVWRMVSAGEFPQPVRIGKATRWKRSDIEEWVKGLE